MVQVKLTVPGDASLADLEAHIKAKYPDATIAVEQTSPANPEPTIASPVDVTDPDAPAPEGRGKRKKRKKETTPAEDAAKQDRGYRSQRNSSAMMPAVKSFFGP